MTLVTREFEITFGSFVVGGASAAQLTGQIEYEEDFPKGFIEYEFIIQDDDLTAFNAKAIAAEAAFRTPDIDMVWKNGGEEVISWKQSANTGFNARPRIIKRTDMWNTGRARKYRVRIEVELPADTRGTSGRQSAKINVTASPSEVRRVIFTGVYTALPSPLIGSRANFEANFLAFATAALAAIDSSTVWEIDERLQQEADDRDKVLTFTIVFAELIRSQAGAAFLDDPELTRQTLIITRHRTAPGDTVRAVRGGGGGEGNVTTPPDAGLAANGGVQGEPTTIEESVGDRLIALSVSYSVAVNKTKTLDLQGKWDNTILPFIISRVRTVAKTSVLALIDDIPGFEFDGNRLSASLNFLASTGSRIHEYRRSVRDVLQPGVELVPAWTGETVEINGMQVNLSRFDYLGPGSVVQIITEVIEYFGDAPEDPFEVVPLESNQIEGLKSVVKEIDRDATPLRKGLLEANFEVAQVNRITSREFYKPIEVPAPVGDPAGGVVEEIPIEPEVPSAERG